MKFLQYLLALASFMGGGFLLFAVIDDIHRGGLDLDKAIVLASSVLLLLNFFVILTLHVHPPETEGEPSLLTLWYKRLKMQQAAKIQNLSEQLGQDSDKPT